MSWEQSTYPGSIAIGGQSAPGEESSAEQTLKFMRANGRRILSLAVTFLIIGTVLLIVVPLRYASTALVVVDPREQRVTTEQTVLPGIGQDAAALQSLVEIAKSDGFLRPLIEKLDVAKDEDISAGETDVSRILERFRNRLDISRRGLTYVIAMTFISNRPDRAAYYANAIAEAFVASQRQSRTDATDDAAGWLNSRLKTLSDNLRSSEDAVAEFKLQHKIVNAGRESTTQQLRVTELSQQLSAARLRAEEAKTKYEQAQRDLKENVDGAIKQDLLSTLRANRTQLNDQIAQKKAVLGDRHPDLVISYNQLNELNRQIEIERKRNIQRAKSDLDSFRDQAKSLEDLSKSVEAQMLEDVQAAVKLQELQRDAEANKNLYEQFLSRFKTTNEQRLLQSSQTKIASFATAPTRSTRPPLAIVIAALVIGSFLAAAAIVAMLDRAGLLKARRPARAADQSPRSPATTLNIPVWSRVPDLRPAKKRTTVWHSPLAEPEEVDPGIHLQGLLDAIASTPSRGGKVVLVTSIENDAGKSTIARSLNLAAMDRGMLSVLIQVESASARAGKTARERDVANGTLASKASVHDVLQLLGDGQKADDPDFDTRSEFDLILIDAPSLKERPEVATIAAHADLAILVVRGDSAIDLPAINTAKAELSKFGAPAIGAVINQIAAPVPAPRSKMLKPGYAGIARRTTRLSS